MTRVDVIVPCYQYGHYLDTCVRSILDQRSVDVRVLVIDDCSPDDSATVAEAIASADSRVTFRRHAQNTGHIRTYNEGIEWASAPYLLLISADDALTDGSLARSVAVLEREPGMTMVFGQALPILGDAEPPSLPGPTDFGYSIVDGEVFINQISDLPRNPVSTPTVVVRTELQKRLGGYDPRLPHAGDLEMWLRFASLGSLGEIDVPQAFRRQHETNMQKRYLASPLGDHLQLQATFEIFAARSIDAERRPAFVSRAFRGVAEDALWQAERAFETGEAARCAALADFAVSLAPALAGKWNYSRLRWKRRIGLRVFQILDQLRSAVRPVKQTPAHPGAKPFTLRLSA